MVLVDTGDFCPTVDGLEDVTPGAVLEPPLPVSRPVTFAFGPFLSPDGLPSARWVVLVTDVDWNFESGAWIAPRRVEETEFSTLGRFIWDPETGRNVDPDNAGTGLDTEFVPASLKLDCFLLVSVLYAVLFVSRDGRC